MKIKGPSLPVTLPQISLPQQQQAPTLHAPADMFAVNTPAPVQLNPPTVPGTVGGVKFTGFDDTKLNSPLKLQDDGQPKSAKYTFAKLAQASNVMPHSKAEAEQWFNTYIRPGMEQAGFHVLGVKGDTAIICTREHPEGEPVDFLRGAGSGDANYQALSWQTQDADAPAMDLSGFGLGDGTGGPLDNPLVKTQRQIGENARADADRLQHDLEDRLREQTISGR